MFVGRERELQSLQNIYDTRGFGMSVIYGRRRVGKSTLITEFIAGKRAVFYTAARVGSRRNLELFSAQVMAALEPELGNALFSSLEDVLDFITARLSGEKLVVVIDEFPYWAEKDEAILSQLQRYIDTRWLDRELMLILCGSALSFMENKVLSEKSPLFGRRTSQIRLDIFNYREAACFVPNYTYEEKAICYGITGGVAKYLALIDGGMSLDDNIKRLFFHTDGYLYDETHNLLTQEFSDITLVNNIIEQIASGETALHAIASRVGEKEPVVLYSLEKLIRVGLVEKRKCITEETNKKKTQYVLSDHMFQFWYAFIPRAQSVIEMGYGDVYYEKVVRPRIHSFMGDIFEEMCRYYTFEQGILGRFGDFYTRVGRWWGMEKIEDMEGDCQYRSADIDVVAVSDIDKTAVVGECKFRNEKTDKGVYDALARRAGLISGKYRVTRLLLFSLGGYTEWYNGRENGILEKYTLEDLYTNSPKA